jgi:hypothetical protein
MQSVLDEVDYAVDNGLPPPIETEEDMALNPNDRDWISKAIKDALEEAKPSGWKNFLYWTQKWGITGTVATVILGLVVFSGTMLFNATNHASAQAIFETKTDGRLTALETSIGNLSRQLAGMQLSDLAAAPITTQTVKKAVELVAKAEETKQDLDPATVSSAGQKFAEVSLSQPEAWQAATALLNYRSSLNPGFPDFSTKKQEKPVSTVTSYSTQNNKLGVARWVGMSKSPNVPELYELGSKNLNEENPNGPAYLVVQGGTLTLDNFRIKRVVFVNAVVVYDGGKTSLEDVYFVNCSFKIARQEKGIQFASAAISRNDTNFSAS